MLGHCRQLRRDGLAVPADLAQLRDELHTAASRRQETTPIEPAGEPMERVTMSMRKAAQRLGLSERTVDRVNTTSATTSVKVGVLHAPIRR